MRDPRCAAESPVTVHVLDGDVPPPRDGIVVLWRQFEIPDAADAISIPRLVEEDADRLRLHYLEWVDAVGAARVDGVGLVDWFRVRPNVSLWWASRIAEKCNAEKSPQIEDAIRLMAFDAWAEGRPIAAVHLHTASAAVASCFEAWCRRRQVPFTWARLARPRTAMARSHRALRFFPARLRAVLWLAAYVARRWPLRGAGVRDWDTSPAATTFASYLMTSARIVDGRARFESAFWGDLPQVVRAEAGPVNWLHLFVPDRVLPTARAARQAIDDFNRAGEGEAHTTIDSFLSVAAIWRTIRDWRRISTSARRIARGFSAPALAGLDVWPLFASEFDESFSGIAGISGALHLNLLERALNRVRAQRRGVFLLENQEWELCFMQLWRARRFGPLVGYAHATVRFWDLRYYWSPAALANRAETHPPMPDVIAVNGPAADQQLQDAGYPPSRLQTVEAVRYLHLKAGRRAASTHGHDTRLLVLGDFLERSTHRLMTLLSQALAALHFQVRVVVKPHPVCPVRREDYSGLRFETTTEPVGTLLADCDVVLTGAITSAGVEAYVTGVPVIALLDPATLNLSPLRGCNGVTFVSSPLQLAQALARQATAGAEQASQSFFCLDPSLVRWRQLLGGISVEPSTNAAAAAAL